MRQREQGLGPGIRHNARSDSRSSIGAFGRTVAEKTPQAPPVYCSGDRAAVRCTIGVVGTAMGSGLVVQRPRRSAAVWGQADLDANAPRCNLTPKKKQILF